MSFLSRLLVAVAAGSILLSGCVPGRESRAPTQATTSRQSPQIGAVGPLSYASADAATVCTSAKAHIRFMLATHVSVAAGHQVRIEEIVPAEPLNLTVGSIYFVPITGDLEMLIEPIPPRKAFREGWKRRTAAAGTTIASTDHVQLAAEITTDPHQVSSLKGFDITYSDNHTGEVVRTRTNLSLKVEPDHCGA